MGYGVEEREGKKGRTCNAAEFCQMSEAGWCGKARKVEFGRENNIRRLLSVSSVSVSVFMCASVAA